MQKVAFELNPKDGQDSLNGNGRGLSGKREGLSKEGGKKHQLAQERSHLQWLEPEYRLMKTVGKTTLLGEGRLQCQAGSLDFIPQTTGAIGRYYFNQIPLGPVMSVSKSKVHTSIQTNQQLFYKHTHTHKYLCHHNRGGLSSTLTAGWLQVCVFFYVGSVDNDTLPQHTLSQNSVWAALLSQTT